MRRLVLQTGLLTLGFSLALGAPLAVAHDQQKAKPTAAAAKPDAALVAAVAGDVRAAENRARDESRRPAEALAFWGLKPGMTILEVQPGGAPQYWTEILAPYAKATGGKYFATAADLNDPKLADRSRQARIGFEQRYADIAKWGQVGLVNWGLASAPPPANTFDFALVSRSVHGWMRGNDRNVDMVAKSFRDLYAALKPGGILAIEQHRASGTEQTDPRAMSGYVTEAFVIQQAEKAGFRLDGKSEINANPKDTKDHPFGVWTLPPSLASQNYGDPNSKPDPNFDHSKYKAIGESDRMTLRFVKPKG
ncbi:MAG: methyltransferase [Steroidobacteraceae bacterium]|jgi:predicted methyltransferase|nr:methyltransferase [Steroidobacteraceae bacterium]